jgi:uncharacterized protein (TIGR03083 family)
MDHSQHIAAIGREGAAFRAAVATAPFDARVPACPDWTVADLLRHLAQVHYFWGTIITAGASGPDDVPRVASVADSELLPDYDVHLAALLAALSSRAPQDRAWTWADDHSIGFIARRMALETAVHRWDAEAASGAPAGIEPGLASDGIDEFLEHFLPDVEEASTQVGGSVHIHCGDVAGEWTIRPGDDGYDVTREHAKGDCALRGAASDLLLALWRRVGTETIDVVGDVQVATRFLAATNLV